MIIKNTYLSIRYLTGIVFILLATSCIKEQSLETGTPPQPIDSLPASENCRLVRLVQGTDTVLTLHYDVQGRLFKLTDHDVPSNFTDSFMADFDGLDRVVHVRWDSPFPLDVYHKYYPDGKMAEMKILDAFSPADSTVFKYTYSPAQSMFRKDTYSYSSFGPGGLFEYAIFSYNSKGNITDKQTYGADDRLRETIFYTYLDQPNSFKSLAYFSDPFNVFDMRNAIDVEACWNTNDIDSVTFVAADAIGTVIKRKKLNYEKDSKGRVIKVISETYYNSPGDGPSFNYRFFYECF